MPLQKQILFLNRRYKNRYYFKTALTKIVINSKPPLQKQILFQNSPYENRDFSKVALTNIEIISKLPLQKQTLSKIALTQIDII